MAVEFTEKLIEEVRNRPIIYQLSHPDYKNKTKKIQAWREIARELNEEVSALKVKWKNLKDTYKKYKQSKRTSSSQSTKKLRNWAWASHMSFINPSVFLNETQSSMAVLHENISDNAATTALNNREEMGQGSAENERVQEGSADNERVPEPGVAGTQNGRMIYRRHRRNQDPTDRMSDYIRNRKKDRNNDGKIDVKYDGADYLFLGYADTFKKLSKRKQVLVKFQIAKILMEAELSDLDTEMPRSPYMATTATPGSCSIKSDTDANLTTPESRPVVQITFDNYSMKSDATEHETQTSYILPHMQPTDLSNSSTFDSEYKYHT